MQHLRRPAHCIGYQAPDIRLRERGAVRAWGGIPGGQRVLPPLAQGVMPGVHGEAPYDTVAHTVDGRRKAAWRGRYCTQGSADYRTRCQRLRVSAEGQVSMVLPSMESLRHPLCSIQPHEAICKVTAGPSSGEAPDMQDGWRVRGAGPLRGLCCSVRGGIARVPETWGGLRYAGTVFLGRASAFIPGWPCLLRTGDQEAGRRLGSRKSVCRRSERGAHGRLCCRLPVFLILAVALAWGFVPRYMRGRASRAVRGSHCSQRPVSGA